MRERSRLASVIVLTLAAVGALALAAPAYAFDERGHEFGFSFGENELTEPVGVAVDEATGEVYVADHGAKRVKRFRCPVTAAELEAASSCTLLSVFPSTSKPAEAVAVDNSTTDKAVDPSAGDVYVAWGNHVVKFSPSGEELDKWTITNEFGEAEHVFGVAVDDHGSLWVDASIVPSDSEEAQEEPMLERFTDAQKNKAVERLELTESENALREGPEVVEESVDGQEVEKTRAVGLRRGLAINAQDYLDIDYAIEESYEAEENEETVKHNVGMQDLVGEMKVAEAGEAIEEEEGEEEELPEPTLSLRFGAFDHENSTGVATDGDEAYIDNGTSVAAFVETGTLVQRFGAGDVTNGSGLTVDAQSGAVYVTDDAKHAAVRVFKPSAPGKPVIVAERAAEQNAEAGSATLEASINPFGAETRYSFEYGTSTSYGTTLPVPEGTVESAGYQAVPARVDLTGLQTGVVYHFRVVASNSHGSVAGPDQTFRLVPTGVLDGREWELVSGANSHGASVLPPAAASVTYGVMRASASGAAISYTTDAPSEPSGEGSRAPERYQSLSVRGASGWTPKEISVPDDVKGGFDTANPPMYMQFSEDLSLSVVDPYVGQSTTNDLAEPPLSPPLSAAEEGHQETTPYLRADAPVTPSQQQPEVTAEEEVYKEAEKNGEREAAKGTPDGDFLAMLDAENVLTKEPFGGVASETNFVEGGVEKVQFLGATPDLTHVVLASNVPLAPAEGASAGLYELTPSAPENQLEPVSVLPDGAPAPARAQLGSGLTDGKNGPVDSRNAISTDGSRVFWEQGSPEDEHETHLYVRDLAKGATLEIGGVTKPEPAERGPNFQIASRDGTRVFFTDEQKLVPGSGATKKEPELYMCEVLANFECAITDVSEVHAGESAEVQGAVLGISEEACEGSGEGCSVYFVANGALTAGASRGSCTNTELLPGAKCNLYVRRFNGETRTWEKPTLIASLSSRDDPDWRSNVAAEELWGDLSKITSRVSPNGKYLAFMSREELTGYRNVDAVSGARDEEVYIYQAEAEAEGRPPLICVSCDPDGSAPRGVEDTPEAAEASGEGHSPLVDRSEIWHRVGEETNEPVYLAGNVPGWTSEAEHAPASQSRYLTDEGRLFFDASDALVPQDTNGKEDVYEYEPEGVGICTSASATFVERDGGCIGLISTGKSPKESAFFEASESGGDVFFLTNEDIHPGDHNQSYSVYDAHECTSASPCSPLAKEPPPPCEDESACKGEFSSLPGFGSLVNASSSGNLAAKSGVLSQVTNKKPTTKPLTRAQKLAKALKTCRKAHKRNKRKRAACEKAARKRYGSKPRAKKSKHSLRQSSRSFRRG
ncbi:MAG TPA: hypothetical protein VMF09_14675 [Solirubrobacteraceae bacterium]|nr:hypothetical protein [Solirubrobacteraceae bacterium]